MTTQTPSTSVWTINGRFVTQQTTGVQRYAREIVRGIDDILTCSRDLAGRLGFEIVMPPHEQRQSVLQRIGTRTTRVGSSHLWEQAVLPWYVRSGLLSLCNLGPALAKRHVVCIHDANTFILPDVYSRGFRALYRTMLPVIGRRAKRVATVSQFSADMLVQFGICRREKIFVAPNGHEHALSWDSTRSTLSNFRHPARPYVLLLGSLAVHKNIRAVVEGADALDSSNIDIVIVGAASKIFLDTTNVVRSNIRYTGYVTDDDLALLYQHALCLAFPSTTEGFGLPVLEAMAIGCPVISSPAASLREVGADAVLYVDPHARNDWKNAIVALSKDSNLRADLVARGRQRALQFSWKRSAERYIEELLRLSSR
jgi:glycosyltransferase involved in cell wall biosynthesis